jgi:hypothetical protein
MSIEHAPQRDPRRFRRTEASVYLWEKHGIKRAPATLAKDAVKGGGPKMTYVFGLPLYTADHLDEYAKEGISAPVRSTAERRLAMAESGRGA